ncbi:MAG: hypothetical protein ACM3OB_10480 [Acidobacteriota bacterium]
MTNGRRLASVVVLALVGGGTAARGANLIQNGTFDTNTTGWTNVAVWDGTRDANNNPNSGSDQVAITSAGPATCTDSVQVVPVSGGTGYDASADILIASALTNVAGQAAVVVDFCSDANCAAWPSTIVGSFSMGPANNSNALDTWLHVASGAQIAPAGAQAAIIFLNPCANATGTFTANFDNVVLQQAATAEVPTLGLGGILALAAGLAIVALLTLARWRV